MGETRIGSRERELAMGALDEHRRAGRLEPAEYTERSAVAARARFRSELDALFADLPPPHPAGGPDGAPGALAVSDPTPAPDATRRPPTGSELPELVAPVGEWLGRNAGILSALAPVAATVLFIVTGLRFPQIFLLVPVAIGLLAYLGHRHGH